MSAAAQTIEANVSPAPEFLTTKREDTASRFTLILPDSMLPARLRFDHVWSDEEIIRFSAANPLVRVEQEPNGEILIMSPTGSHGTEQETDVLVDLAIWARADSRGRTYNSAGGFRLADGSMRVPDAAWVSWERIRAVPPDRTKGFYPLCPEFVVEVRSESDSLNKLREKMDQWMANGCELAWLIDPSRKAIEIYRPGQEPEVQEAQSAVYGEGPVAGFVLELARIWS